MREKYVHIIAVLDRSGSMSSIQQETIDGFNAFIDKQKVEDGEATLTLALFDEDYDLVHDFIDIKNIPLLDNKTYYARGYTGLLDAVGKTVNSVGAKLASMKEEDRPSKVVMLIMTDGHENASVEFTHNQIKEMIEHQKTKYSWDAIFIGASNIDAVASGSSMGIGAAQTYSYSASSVGTQRLFKSVSNGMTSLRRCASTVGASFNMANPIDITNQNDESENDADTNQ